MNEYELTVLIHPDLEADLDKALKPVRDLIATAGGNITSEESWGKKRLQYPIAKQNFAVYQYIVFDAPSTGIQKLDTTLNITEGVIRHLLIKVDPKQKAALAAQEDSSKDDKEE